MLPYLQLGLEGLGPEAALAVDRIVLAAARKLRAYNAQVDLSEPGEMGIAAMLRLLARQYVER